MKWYLRAFRKYAQFQGRARRREYRFFTLINTLVTVTLFLLYTALLIKDSEFTQGAETLLLSYILVSLLPGLAVTVRRFHDTGKSSSWWFLINIFPISALLHGFYTPPNIQIQLWYVICFIPFNGLITLFFIVLNRENGINRWGHNPKQNQTESTLSALKPQPDTLNTP